jgi:hypothetical protein
MEVIIYPNILFELLLFIFTTLSRSNDISHDPIRTAVPHFHVTVEVMIYHKTPLELLFPILMTLGRSNDISQDPIRTAVPHFDDTGSK